jgi:hypothetical protein
MKNPPANQEIDCSILAIRSSDDELRFFRYGDGITWLRVNVSCPLFARRFDVGSSAPQRR